jgi:hypothetical protein
MLNRERANTTMRATTMRATIMNDTPRDEASDKDDCYNT